MGPECRLSFLLFLVTPDFSLVVSDWFFLLLYAIGSKAPLVMSGIFCAPKKMLLNCDPPFFYCKKDSDFGNCKMWRKTYIINPVEAGCIAGAGFWKPPAIPGVPCLAVALWEDLRDPMIESWAVVRVQLADSRIVAIYQLIWANFNNGIDGTIKTVPIAWKSAQLLKYLFLPAFPFKICTPICFLHLVVLSDYQVC